MGPTSKKKKKKNLKKTKWKKHGQKALPLSFFFSLFIFLSFNSLFDSRNFDRQNLSGQTRKVLYATRATREYQKHEISPKIQVNIRKILVFSFSQIYDVLLVL